MSAQLPAGWKEKHTDDGRVYYEDDNTKTTHWKLPDTSDVEAPTVVDDSSASKMDAAKQESFVQHFNKLSRHDTTSLYVLQKAKPLIIEDGQKLFKLFKANEDGEVSHDEIKHACDGGNAEVVKYIEKYSDTALGLLDDKSELAKLLVEIDLNHDEKISELDFLIFFNRSRLVILTS